MTASDIDAIEAAGTGWVPPSGPLDAEIVFVGEAPGWQEVLHKRPFVGESGSILWQLAGRHAGIVRSDVYVTNWHKIILDDGLKKTYEKNPAEAAPWTVRLWAEIEKVKPRIIVPLGGYAVRAILGDGYSLFWSNGVPIHMSAETTVVPIVHPAAGMHEPMMLERTTQGFQGLRRYRDGDVQARDWGRWNAVGPTTEWSRRVEWASPPNFTLRVGIDTEGTVEEPFCLTYSIDGYSAGIIYAHDLVGLEQFRKWLAHERPILVMHHAAHDAAVCATMGIDVWKYPIVDTMILAYVLQDEPRDLKNLTRKRLNIEMSEYEDVVRPYMQAEEAQWRQRLMVQIADQLRYDTQLTPKGKVRMSKGKPVVKLVGPARAMSIHKHLTRGQQLSLDEKRYGEGLVGRLPDLGTALRLVPPEVHQPYAGKDAIVTRALEPILTARVNDAGLDPVSQLDHSILPLMRSMQDTGLHLDIERYWEVLGDVSTRRIAVEAEIRQLVGDPKFNPGSSQQLATFISNETHVPLVKLTKTNKFSTESNVLSQLKHEHPIIPLVLEYRELAKYENTYLLPAGQLIRQTPDGCRLFAELSQTSVVSGRLAAYNPNVLAWPARTKLGLRVRSIFTAPPGKVLGSWDFSQIELRILAALSGDPVMTAAFLAGRDLHQNLASSLFGVPYETVDKQTQRLPAKTVHYCLIYGGGGGKVYEELRSMGITSFTRADCDKLVDETWRLYHIAGAYLRGAGQEARQKGYVTSILGRRRFLTATQLQAGRDEWDIRALLYEAERQAGNFKIQGAAAEITKRAMVGVWEEIMPDVPGFRLWLQIHDELMGELPAEAWDEVNRRMVEVMTRDSWITSPIQIETDGKAGASWDMLK